MKKNNTPPSSNNKGLSRSARRRRNRRNRRNPPQKSISRALGSQSGRLNDRPISQNITTSQQVSFSPLSLFETRVGSTPGGLRVKGREYLATVWSDGGSVKFSYNVWNSPISQGGYLPVRPASLMRAQAYASIFEEYFFHNVKIQFLSVLPTTTTGAVSLDCEFDQAAPIPSSSAFYQTASHLVSFVGNAYSDGVLGPFPGTLSNYNRYFNRWPDSTGTVVYASDRQTIQFKIDGVCSTSLGATNIGHLVIEYDLEFYTPIESLSSDPTTSLKRDLELHMVEHAKRESLTQSVTDAESKDSDILPIQDTLGENLKLVSVPKDIYEEVVHLIDDYKKTQFKPSSNIEGSPLSSRNSKKKDQL
jgi:hypothetical protein